MDYFFNCLGDSKSFFYSYIIYLYHKQTLAMQILLIHGISLLSTSKNLNTVFLKAEIRLVYPCGRKRLKYYFSIISLVFLPMEFLLSPKLYASVSRREINHWREYRRREEIITLGTFSLSVCCLYHP